MKMNIRSNNFDKWVVIRALLIITIILHTYALIYWVSPVYTSGKLFASLKWNFIGVIGTLTIILEILILGFTWSKKNQQIVRIFNKLKGWLGKLGVGNLFLFLIFVISYPILILGRFEYFFDTTLLRLVLLWTVLVFGSLVLYVWDSNQKKSFTRNWIEFPALTLASASTAYLFGTYSTEINSYPFSLHWSETSRFYYASLFAPVKIYGAHIPPSVLHPSRYLMQSLPFLLPNTTLLVHRAWQVFLWIFTTLLTAYVLAGRISIDDWIRRWTFILWAVLFLLIGPVYYHLQIPVLIILLAFNRPGISEVWLRNTLSITALLIASGWAGISRINWFPVPGILAAALILLEISIPASTYDLKNNRKRMIMWMSKTEWNYVFLVITVIVLGTLIAYASQAFYIMVSGNERELFSSSFTSQLYWYRLLPNPTYPVGILPAILLVTLPFFLIIYARLFRKQNGSARLTYIHPVRLLGLGLSLIVLFLGGIVVSTKIGGGSNLHNLDSYFVLLLLISSYFFFDRVKPDGSFFYSEKETISNNSLAVKNSGENRAEVTSLVTNFRVGMALAFIIPIVIGLTASGFRFLNPEQTTLDRYFHKMNELIEAAKKRGGDILFITDRHLLTFHYIEDVSLVPEYEKVFLMEMAMSGNQNYLNKFQDDLKNHRFSLIISEPLYFKSKGSSERFGEENDVWIERVAKPLDCYYMEERTLPDVNIQLLVPNSENQNCQ